MLTYSIATLHPYAIVSIFIMKIAGYMCTEEDTPTINYSQHLLKKKWLKLTMLC
uniref:Uncharacterized protein n=1 Tax=Arundo donax TaxID=35708 RepID=A0A0A8YJW1_ARUDO